MHVAPEGGNGIYKLPAINVVKINPFPSFEYQVFFFSIYLHLGKGMPKVFLIPAFKELRVPVHGFKFYLI